MDKRQEIEDLLKEYNQEHIIKYFDKLNKNQEETLFKQIQKIAECAFCDCISLECIDLPENLLFLGENAFAKCVKLKDAKH